MHFRCKLKFNFDSEVIRQGELKKRDFSHWDFRTHIKELELEVEFGLKICLEIRFAQNLGCDSLSTCLQDTWKSYRENIQVSANNIKKQPQR